MSRGFTLLEVVVALLVLEIGIVAALGTLTLAAAHLTRAEQLERAVATSEGIIDSLSQVAAPADGAMVVPAGSVAWTIGEDGVLHVRALDPQDSLLFSIYTALERP